MTSPCGKIRIPINEEGRTTKSQIQEYLDEYHGEGIQHIALGTGHLRDRWRPARAGVAFLDTPDTYYELVDACPATARTCSACANAHPDRRRPGAGLLLQIFTQNAIGPIFFEIIQRKGNEGFGEGNFKALFESIELDQIRRGVLAQKSC
jgi:4-hydroxyphenylpyruvate dioxygenase